VLNLFWNVALFERIVPFYIKHDTGELNMCQAASIVHCSIGSLARLRKCEESGDKTLLERGFGPVHVSGIN
jgi:hypothetical protein